MKLSHVFAITAAAAILAGCAQWNERFEGAQPVNFNEMPPAVQATVRNEIGNQPITAITRERKYGDPSYRVEVQQPGLNPTLWVATNGSIIKESRQLVISNADQYKYQNHYENHQINEAAGAQPHSQNPVPPKQSSGSNY